MMMAMNRGKKKKNGNGGDCGNSERGWVIVQFPTGNWERRRGRKEFNEKSELALLAHLGELG